MELGKAITAPRAVLATGMTALAVAGCGGAIKERNVSNSHINANHIENTVNADCNQTQMTPEDYISQLGGEGTNIMTPLPSSSGSIGNEFKSASASVTAPEVAKDIARNPAAEAVVWTIINQDKTNISVDDVDSVANTTASELFSQTSARQEICKRIVRAVLEAPEEGQLQSITGRLTHFEPAYSSNTLTGIDAKVEGNTGPMATFNIGVIAGSANETLQKEISDVWGITPNGDIVEVAYKIGNNTPSKHGKPMKATVKGHIHELSHKQQQEQSNQQPEQQQGGQAGESGSGNHAPSQANGNTPENQPNGKSTGPKGKGPKGPGKESHPGKGKSPGGGKPPTTTTPTETTPTETTPTRTTPTRTTPTETTPTQTTPTRTTPTETTPTRTTPTTTTPTTTTPTTTTPTTTTPTTTTPTTTTPTTTTPTKGPAPCNPNVAEC